MDALIWLAMAVLTQPFPARPVLGIASIDCVRLAPMPVVGIRDSARISRRYPMQVIRIDTAILNRMPMPVDRRPPCYQRDSTARK